MSLVTRCPACGTTFKVVKDQLRISDGWVRCGRCSEVFDATVDLHEAADAPSSKAPAPAPAPKPAAANEGEPGLPPSGPHPDADQAQAQGEASARATLAEADFLDDEQDEPIAEAAVHPPQVDEAAPVRSARDEVLDFGIGDAPGSWPEAEALLLADRGRTAVRPPPAPPLTFPDIELALPREEAESDRPPPPVEEVEEVDNTQFAKALRRARAKSAKIAKAKARAEKVALASNRMPLLTPTAGEADLPEDAPASSSSLSMPSLGAPEATSFWRRLWVRRSLLGVAILAALLLVVQVLHQERDLIVARQPSLRPLLAGLCGVLGCELSALRQINDIKIDGASFARDKSGDGFQLSFTLRNGANLPLAMPAVELTLLDTQEHAVVRRVIMPGEFGAPPVLPAGAERAASLSLNLTGPEAAALPPVAGFRVEALYP
jgi:predicted Zn finger-like uncharacterized protein